MAQASQFNFTLRELTEALIRAQDLTEGKWVGGFDLGIGVAAAPVGNAPNPNPVDLRPTAFIQINGVTLSRYVEGSPETLSVVDAAKLYEQDDARPSTTSRSARRPK